MISHTPYAIVTNKSKKVFYLQIYTTVEENQLTECAI